MNTEAPEDVIKGPDQGINWMIQCFDVGNFGRYRLFSVGLCYVLTARIRY